MNFVNFIENIDILIFLFQFIPFANLRKFFLIYFKKNKFDPDNEKHKRLRDYYQKFDLSKAIKTAEDSQLFFSTDVKFRFHQSEAISYINVFDQEINFNVRVVDFEYFYSHFLNINGPISVEKFDMDHESTNLFVEYQVKKRSSYYLEILDWFLETTTDLSDLFTGFRKKVISRSILYGFIDKLKNSKIYPIDQKSQFMTPEDLESLRSILRQEENLLIKFPDLQTSIGKALFESLSS